MKITFTTIFLITIFHLVSYGFNQNKKVLFIGNSYTHVNNLPAMVAAIANSMGDTLVHDNSTPGGYTLQSHSTNTTTLSKISQGGWDRVVLQEQSQLPAFPDWQVQQDCYPYAKFLDSLIKDKNPCAETIFYMTWGRENGDAVNCPNFPPLCTYSGMDSLLRVRYSMMANTHDAFIAPAGPLWRYLRTFHPAIHLYATDGSHPSIYGTYAAACAFYTILFQKDVSLSNFLPGGISASDAMIIKNAAKTVVYDSLDFWNGNVLLPQADFTFNSLGNNQYSFTNLSQNSTNYEWDFGDGSPLSNIANPVHTFPSSGNYTVTLTTQKCSDKSISSKPLHPTIIAQTESEKPEIYPNPSSSMLYIRFNQYFEGTAIVHNKLGQVVTKVKIATSLQEINLESLNKGVYFIQVYNRKERMIYSRQIVKE